jgi:hypothetical protein
MRFVRDRLRDGRSPITGSFWDRLLDRHAASIAAAHMSSRTPSHIQNPAGALGSALAYERVAFRFNTVLPSDSAPTQAATLRTASAMKPQHPPRRNSATSYRRSEERAAYRIVIIISLMAVVLILLLGSIVLNSGH